MGIPANARRAALAAAILLALSACSAGTDGTSPASTLVVRPGSPIDLSSTSLPAVVGATTPRSVVERFLGAEIANDREASFALLSDPNRARIGDMASWTAEHADLPRYTGFDVVEAPEPTGDTATVTTDVRLVPGIDVVTGLAPGRATVRWKTTRGAAGWTIDLDASELTPVYPDDGGARDAALTWVSDRQACRPAELLIGDPTASTVLCDKQGTATASDPASVGDLPIAADLVAAFGPEAVGWAKAISIDGPVKMNLVAAPIGDTWTIIGATG